MSLQSVNPHNNKILKIYKEYSKVDINKKINNSKHGFYEWRESTFAQRTTVLNIVAKKLLDQKEGLAKLMALEMGKPLAKGIAEIEKCAWVCKYYAQQGKKMLQDELVQTDYSQSFITYNPLGVVLTIMPWNYPFWQVFRCLAPNIMAGNTIVLKHASNVSGCASAIKKIFDAVHTPNVFELLLIDYHGIDSIIRHPAISAVTLTGSTRAGKSVAAAAGNVLKKCVMELGGSDAYIVLKDADIHLAVKECVSSRLKNGGQSCISGKRFIVDKKIIKPFTEAFVEEMKQYKVGNPLDSSNDLGPMARMDLKESLHQQVLKSISKGAKQILTGNVIGGENGAYYPCTVLSNVTPGMPAFDEELFGPVAAIIEAKDETHAIELANNSIYGLGGAVFTKNINKGKRIAAKMIEAGSVFVNVQVNSDPRLPFGGIKESGFGRELGVLGIKEFVNIKSVVVR